MSQQWDEFSKSLVEESLPRRESLKRLGTVFAGALFSSVGLQQAVAGRKIDPCTAFCKCSNKKQTNACIAACRNCGNDPSRLCGNCSGGYVCADLINDFDHCGSCSNYCRNPGPYEHGACIDGRCEYWCVDGADNCDGVCTDLDNDFDHCGSCDNYCRNPGPYEHGACIGGRCEYWCVDGADNCDGVCTDFASDVYNCGACGNVCDGLDLGPDVYVACVSGACEYKVCSPFTSYNWDSNNCGRCGNVCPPGSACSFGFCGSPCINCGD